MTIKVKGETYDDPADLVYAIGQLRAKLSDAPEGGGKLALLAHIEELESALEPPPLGALPEDEDREDDPLPEGAEPVCPMCNGLGVLAVDPPDDPNANRCESCDGFGKVYTGSRVPGHDVRDCPTCQGQGYTTRETFTPGAAQDANTAATVPAQAGALWNEEEKFWNPPPGQQPPWAGATWKPLLGGWE